MPEKRIKVLIVINDFLIGGAQKLIVDMLARIDTERFEPVLLTLFRFGEDEREYLYDALPPDTRLHCLHFSGIRDWRSWRELYRLLRVVDPDVVLANLFFSNTIMRLLKPLFRYRVCIVEHNTYIHKTRVERLLDRLLSLLTERIVAVSKTVAAFTSAQEGIPLRKFTVIHNGLNLEAIRAEMKEYSLQETRREVGFIPEDNVILNVSRIIPQKNHKLLIDGFALFVQAHPQYRLLLVGGGSHEEKMRAYTKSVGLNDRVQFTGYRKDVPRFFAIATFFVSTSTIEGFGIAHAEALACGLPVLTTKTAGPDEMITEGINGFFIMAPVPQAVADGLERMIASDLPAMRLAAADSAEAYSIERAVAAYEALFESVAYTTRQ
jgi:glycosyltransferase involved in cell wall biosynthesis